MKRDPPVHWKTWRMHHAYLGILMMIYGFTGIADTDTCGVAWVVIGIGAYTLIDDIIEHTITGSTPLRILYDKVIYPLLRRFKNEK